MSGVRVLPAREVGAAHLPAAALGVRRQNERALARADQYPYAAHGLLLVTLVCCLETRRRSLRMCRNIKTLANFAPPATDEEIRASALQFVRKLSGTARPSQANAAGFDRAVEEGATVAHRLIHSLPTNGAPRNRDDERRKAHERALKRFGPPRATGQSTVTSSREEAS